MMSRRDPIVDEVRKHRAEIAREHGNRLDSILAAFRREEARWPAGTVSRPPKLIMPRAQRAKAGTRPPNKRLPVSRNRSADKQE